MTKLIVFGVGIVLGAAGFWVLWRIALPLLDPYSVPGDETLDGIAEWVEGH